jgi:hypothetical protein
MVIHHKWSSSIWLSTINGQAVYGYSNTGIYFQSMFPEPNFNDDL